MMIRRIYSVLVKSFIILALTMLGVGGALILVDLSIGYEFIRLGLWMLIITPILPIASIYVESIKSKDLTLLAVTLVIILIIVVNLVYYGFGKIPFLTLPFPLLPPPLPS